MTVETFTIEDFETVLGQSVREITGGDRGLAKIGRLGLVDREYSYEVRVTGTNKRLVVRSSIKGSGVSAGTGEDSIRVWVEYWWGRKGKWVAMGKGDRRWTTRVTGWERRLTEVIQECYQIALDDSRGRRYGEVPEVETPTSTPEPTPEPTPSTTLPGISDEKVQVVIVDDTEDEDVCRTIQKRTPNPQQSEAINQPVDGAVRVLAGPGSGKTFVVEERVGYLLENGIDPDNIVVVTFSRPMADEMLDRITRRNPEMEGTDQVTTIHALCYRMLRASDDRRRVLFKEWEVKKTLQKLIEDLWTDPDNRPGWKVVHNWINTAKSLGLGMDTDTIFFVDTLGRYHGMKLDRVRERFDKYNRRSNLLTFADMLLDTETRLELDRSFREKFQGRYTHIIVDEGQDTSGQAMRILTTLAQPQDNLFIVGDTDQLLYRFSGATPEVNLYQGFSDRYPDGAMVKLETNYRSTKVIVETVNRLIGQNYQTGGGPYEDQYHKVLTQRDGVEDGESVTFQMYPDVIEESRSVVEDIKVKLGDGSRSPGDFFIGARTRAQLGYLEGPLVRAKVPFVNRSGGSFWNSRHVADVISYVRLAVDERDDEAFGRVYRIGSNWMTHPWGKEKGEYCSHRYLGRAFLNAVGNSYSKMVQEYERYTRGSRSTLKRSYTPGIEDLIDMVRELQGNIDGGPSEMVQMVVENCYERYLRTEEGLTSTDESENGKLEDLQTVVDVAGQFDEVGDFLDHVGEMVRAAEDAKDKNWDGYVVLSTIHGLKGLERSVVYGVGLCEGIDRVSKKPRGLLPHTFSLTQPPQMDVLPSGGMGRVEDERCVCFVLVSRAKEEVHLSGCETYRTAMMGPSRFVYEMGLIEVESESESVDEEEETDSSSPETEDTEEV